MRIQSALLALLISFAVIGQEPCDALNADFTWTNTGNGVQFSNGTTGNGEPTTWLWSFGDNTGHTAAQPFHTYTQPGTYEVCLTVISAYEVNGNFVTCQDTACSFIQVGGDPCGTMQACFVTNDLGNGNFFFDNCTSGPLGTQLFWDFGDGTQSTVTNVEHHFDEPGTYTVCLFAYWQNCADTTCTTITVTGDNPCDNLNANFIWSGGVNGVNFANEVIDNTWTYYWQFGDGTTANGPNPFHTYPGSGTYETCLIVWTWDPVAQDTCFQDHCEMVEVIGEDPCADLQVIMAWFPGEGTTVQFVGTTNFPVDGFVWNFGDGQEGYSSAETHTYSEPGVYFVCFSAYLWNIQTQDTCWVEDCRSVVVGMNDPCEFLQACFQPTPWGTNAYLFDNCTPNEQGTQYEWDFGDGNTSSLLAPTHVYTTPGTFTVCLWATWQNCTDSTCQTVTVDGGDPCFGLNANFSYFTTPNGTQFSNGTAGAGIQTSYSWTFGDGSTSTDAQPFHTYTAPGTYEACLQVLTFFELAGGGLQTCVDTTCNTVIIGGGDPCVEVQACYVTNVLPNNGVLLDNCSTGPPNMQFSWSYGDGSSSITDYAEHYYDQPGTYNVCLIVFTQDCADTLCTTVVIGDSLDCNGFTSSFEVEVTGNAVVFYAQSSIPAEGMSWSFGDGTFGEGSPVTHLYEPLGSYEVCLDSWYWNEATQDSCYAHSCETIDLIHVGIGPLLSADAFNLYPQPAHDRLTITGAALSMPLQARFFGMDGKLEQQEQVNALPHQVDISTLAPAVHVLQLELNGQRFNYRIVVE